MGHWLDSLGEIDMVADAFLFLGALSTKRAILITPEVLTKIPDPQRECLRHRFTFLGFDPPEARKLLPSECPGLLHHSRTYESVSESRST